MLKRIITAIVAVCVLVPILSLSDTVVFPIAVAIVSVISLYELFKCFGVAKNLAVTLPLYAVAAVLPFGVRFLSKRPWNAYYFTVLVFIGIAVYGIYLFSLIVWSHGKLPFGDTMAMMLMSLYVIAAMTSIVYIRDFRLSTAKVGSYIYLLIFVAAWITDIFAYFTGYFFGKHKLIEDVSPKKTVEGSIGGIFFCMLSFVAFGLIVKYGFHEQVNVPFFAISGVVLSLVAQVGDLIMSVIKRHYGIKDFGKIFPGHGGMLDRFDSILAVSLALCAIVMLSSLFEIPLIGSYELLAESIA